MMMSSLMYKNKNKIYVSANENFNLNSARHDKNVIKSNISFRHARSQTSVNICPHGIKYRKMVAYSIGKIISFKEKKGRNRIHFEFVVPPRQG